MEALAPLTPDERQQVVENDIEKALADSQHLQAARIKTIYTHVPPYGEGSMVIDYIAVNGHSVESLMFINDQNRGGLCESHIDILGRMALARDPL